MKKVFVVIICEYFTQDSEPVSIETYVPINIQVFDSYDSALNYFNFMCYSYVDQYKKHFEDVCPNMFLLQDESRKSGLKEYFIVNMTDGSRGLYYIEIYEKTLYNQLEEVFNDGH